jgi:hypothetical protein
LGDCLSTGLQAFLLNPYAFLVLDPTRILNPVYKGDERVFGPGPVLLYLLDLVYHHHICFSLFVTVLHKPDVIVHFVLWVALVRLVQ